jgi:hypothetical protein
MAMKVQGGRMVPANRQDRELLLLVNQLSGAKTRLGEMGSLLVKVKSNAQASGNPSYLMEVRKAESDLDTAYALISGVLGRIREFSTEG